MSVKLLCAFVESEARITLTKDFIANTVRVVKVAFDPKPDDNEPVPDAENPEWTADKFARSIRFNELPENLRNKLSAIQEASRKKRGLQKEPTKKLV